MGGQVFLNSISLLLIVNPKCQKPCCSKRNQPSGAWFTFELYLGCREDIVLWLSLLINPPHMRKAGFVDYSAESHSRRTLSCSSF